MNDEQAIRDLVKTWMIATKSGDSQTVLDLMTDDVMFLVPGQPPFGKSRFAQATASQGQAGMEFDGRSEIQEIRVLGDWAYMVSKLEVRARSGGQTQPTVRAGYTLTILRKTDGRWQVARDANLLQIVANNRV